MAKLQEAYREFLRSPDWQRVRDLVVERDRGKCQRCGYPGKHVHHKTYAHRGDELNHLDDLELLCYNCHRREHPGKEMSLWTPFDRCFICGSWERCGHREEELSDFNSIPKGRWRRIPQPEVPSESANALSPEQYKRIMAAMSGKIPRKSPGRYTRTVEKSKKREFS